MSKSSFACFIKRVGELQAILVHLLGRELGDHLAQHALQRLLRSAAVGRRRTRAGMPQVLGLQADFFEHGHRPVAAVGRALADSLDDHRLHEGRFDRHPRVHAAVGVLKDDLQLPPQPRSVAAAQRRQVDAVVAHLPASGSISRRMARPAVVLPQPDSPTRPSVCPR